MQDRYTGDIGDFGKLGLLRWLSTSLSIGVNWYLVPDESHNGDGRHTNYVTQICVIHLNTLSIVDNVE